MESVFYSHIVPALLVYITCLIIFLGIVYFSMKTAKASMTDEMYKEMRERMFKLIKLVIPVFTLCVGIVIIMSVFFLSNPFENQDAGRIPQAQQRHIVEPSVTGHDTKKAEEMNQQAFEENTNAMEDIFKFADEAEKGESECQENCY